MPFSAWPASELLGARCAQRKRTSTANRGRSGGPGFGVAAGGLAPLMQSMMPESHPSIKSRRSQPAGAGTMRVQLSRTGSTTLMEIRAAMRSIETAAATVVVVVHGNGRHRVWGEVPDESSAVLVLVRAAKVIARIAKVGTQ